MKPLAIIAVIVAVAGAGCLRSTAFTCTEDDDCGAQGICEAIGYCSVPNADCGGTGRSYSDSAGRELANTCVLDPGGDPPGDAAISGCPASYVALDGAEHRYQALVASSWDAARTACRQTSTTAYLAVPDDAAELASLAAIATMQPFWIGIDDRAQPDVFVTQTGAAASFLPWAANQPDQSRPRKECVAAVSAAAIATERCGVLQVAVCECEP